MKEIFSIVDGSCSRERTESLRKSVETFRDACGPCFFGSNPMIPLGRAQQQLAEVSQRFERIELLISGDYQIPDSERRALREKKATEDHVEEEEPTATNNQRQRDENEAVAAFGAVAWAIKEEISKNWSEPGDFSGLSVAFLVKVDREGNVLSVKMTRSSGDARLDESAENAIFKASPLPFPDEGRFYEYLKEFNFIFKPESYSPEFSGKISPGAKIFDLIGKTVPHHYFTNLFY